ncbi:MAG: VapC toxin family PIN domain ribonuclease [Pseudonocardiales bacterium]|nr:MAG: VapC toxin family PIN domain ribonuclease [Pseudonocardiales bacterium]
MLVVDAGPLVAAAATGDRNHARCVELLAHASHPLVVPALVVTEVAYFLADRLGAAAERAFASSLQAGELLMEPVEPADWQRIVELLGQYEDLGLGMVDASVLAACERLDQTELATLDRRHFSVVRPRHCPALALLPA